MCRLPAPPPPAPIGPSSDFVDLEPGWKVRVVVPMLKSGGYLVPSVKSRTSGNSVEIETGDEFLGYEAAYYALVPRDEGGIRIRFSYADIWQKGKMHKVHKSQLPIFEQAKDARYIRLVYLIRVSKADYNMAIVSASEMSALEELTRTVIEQGECRAAQSATCTWVPEGVAVTPEKGS